MTATAHPSMFITFEGGEGAGKSTQCQLLQEALQRQGYEVIRTREPGGTPGAEAIRALLVTGDVNRWQPYTELLLHFAARVDHVHHVIRPALAEGKIVICDRFTDSTIAYQAYGHKLGVAKVRRLHKLVLDGFEPDMTMVLDIAPKLGSSRTGKRGGTENRYEQMQDAFHRRVRRGFQAIARRNPQRCVLFNADATVERIHEQIIAAVAKRMGKPLAPVV